MNEQQQRREDCRREVLAYLATRAAVALGVPSVKRGLSAEWDFTEYEVLHAAQFLMSDGLIVEHVEKLGSSRYYQITANGIRAHERG